MSINYREDTSLEVLQQCYDELKASGLQLNMARGKPCAEQLDLVQPMLDVLTGTSDCNTENGADFSSYGELSGILEAKKLFGEYMGVGVDEIFIAGSSSLNFMYDFLARAMLTGVLGSEKPWGKLPEVKFLCPVPGYDRHFAICEFLGIQMVSIPSDERGPDMALIEKLVSSDDSIRGMWCTPKYSNPLGTTFSDETVRRLAALKPAAKDFRVFCDNAYAAHPIYRDTPLLNMLDTFKEAGNPDMLYLFGSTSKVTFPGAGVSFFAGSKANIDFAVKQLSKQSIGWDKLNMLRHVRFLKDMDGIRSLMEKHGVIMRRRFDIVIAALESELIPRGIGSFTKPDGGYFITYRAPSNTAKRIVSLCKEAGMILTDAGATHPYGNDPDDGYIRIAPSYPSVEEMKAAMQLFCTAARLAAAEIIV